MALPHQFDDAQSRVSFGLFNRYLAGHLLPDAQKGIDDIGVVLLDEASLKATRSSWPPPYYVYAQTLEVLRNPAPMQKPRAPVKAIFLDFTLKDERADTSLPELRDTLDKYKGDGIPAYIVGADTSLLPAQADTDKASGADGLFLAGLGAHPTPVSATGPDLYRDGIVYDLAPPLHAGGAATSSAALAFYSHYCEQNACVAPDAIAATARPMWVVWPARPALFPPAESANAEGMRYSCRQSNDDDTSIASLLLRFYSRLQGDERAMLTDCAPYLALGVQNVINRTPSHSHPDVGLFGGRYVFFGFNLQGFQDVIQPQFASHPLPGTFMQAAAFQNLIAYGNNYLSDTPANPNLRWLTADRIDFVLLAFLLTAHSLLSAFFSRRKASTGHDHATSSPEPAPYGQDADCRHGLHSVGLRCGHLLATAGSVCCIGFFWLSLLELAVIVLLVAGIAFWLEPVVLHIAPTNWITVFGFIGASWLAALPVAWRRAEQRRRLKLAAAG